jgi:branched-chain amino acid transport system permease protein
MATLAFGIIVHVGLVELRGLTGGPNGIGGIPSLNFFGRDLLFDKDIFPFVWGDCIIAILLAENLMRSPHGLVLRAVGSREHVVGTLGNDADRAKRLVLAIGAVFAAVAGAIYAHYIGYLSPSPFTVAFSIKLLVMVAIGGFARIWGVLLGVVFVTLLNELLKPFGQVELLLYGALLIFTMIYCPNGLLSKIGVVIARLFRSTRKENVA